MPNNDTLYSVAWLDLSDGPVEVSVAFMDAFTNKFAMLGQRLDAIGPVRVKLVDPGHHETAPEGRVIRAPGKDVWLLARWIVDGPADLAQAHAMRAGLQVVAPVPDAPNRPRIEPAASTDPANFLTVLNELLGRNPAPAQESDLLAQWSTLELRPDLHSRRRHRRRLLPVDIDVSAGIRRPTVLHRQRDPSIFDRRSNARPDPQCRWQPGNLAGPRSTVR